MAHKRPSTPITAIIFVLLHLLATVPTAKAQGIVADKWTPWFEMGGKLSDELDNGEAELFVPLMGDENSLVFVDFEGRIFEDSIRDGNFALGYREMTNTGFNPGIWVGYAPFRSTNGNVYHGIAAGLELLSHDFDLRLNGYLPFDRDRIISQTSQKSFMQSSSVTQTSSFALGNDQFPAANWIFTDLSMVTTTISTTTTTSINDVTTVREVAMRGFDGEVGARIPFEQMGFADNNVELRVYVGGYFFDADLVDDVAGFKSRLELRVLDAIPGLPGSRLTVDGAYRYDDVRDHDWYAGARLRIPFGGADPTQSQIAQLNDQERRMLDAINREDPLAQTKSTTERLGGTTTTINTVEEREPVEDVLTDVPFDQAQLVANTADLQDAADAAGGNTLIIANGGVVDFDRVKLLDNQTLMGGGGNILVRTQLTGIVSGFDAPGVRPTIAFAAGAPVVTMANNSHVADFDILGGGGLNNVVNSNDGIRGDNLTNVVLEQVTASQLGDVGVRFGGTNTDVLIFGSTASNLFRDGIRFAGTNNSNVTVLDNTIFNVGGGGVEFVNNNNNVLIDGNFITLFNGGGITFNSGNTDTVVTNNTVEFGDDVGIAFNFNNARLTIDGNTIRNIGGERAAIELFESNRDVLITNNTLMNSLAGVLMFLGNSNVTVSDNAMSNMIGSGVVSFDNNTGLIFTNNVLTGNFGFAGFEFGFNGGQITDGTGNIAVGANFGFSVCAGNFTGTLVVDGVSFVNGAGCP